MTPVFVDAEGVVGWRLSVRKVYRIQKNHIIKIVSKDGLQQKQ